MLIYIGLNVNFKTYYVKFNLPWISEDDLTIMKTGYKTEV